MKAILYFLPRIATPQAALMAGVFLLGGLLAAQAQTSTWSGNESPDTNWVTDDFENWGPVGDPAGNNVVFHLAGSTASSSTVTNTVNEDISVDSLTYQYNSTTNYHVTEIVEGVTLSVGGTTNVFTVGGLLQALPVTTTHTVIQGGGALDINQSGGLVYLGNNTSGSFTQSIATLSMRGLASFTANLGATGSFNVGTSNGSNTPSPQGSQATVTLADTNAITANSFLVGSTYQNQPVGTGVNPSTVNLGRSNTIHANLIGVGDAFNTAVNGILQFDAAVLDDSPSVTIRGADGTSAVANFRIGTYNTTGVGASNQIGLVDFSGGSVDALVGNLMIGRGSSSSATSGNGTLTMDAGTFTATTTILAEAPSSSATGTVPTQGTLNVGGGNFTTTNMTLANSTNNNAANTYPLIANLNVSGGTVEVTGANGIRLGVRGGASNTATLTANVNLTGGSLIVSGGNLAEFATNNANTVSTLTLDGGTLDMDGNAIGVDTFHARSGALQNIGEIRNGAAVVADLVKTTSGTLSVSGSNNYTGDTLVNAGTLLVNGAHTNAGDYFVNTGGTLGGNGTITTASGAGVTLAAGAFLSPGNSPGTLSFDLGEGTFDISAGVAAADSAALIFELGSASDQIVLTNALSVLEIGSGLLEFDDFSFTALSGFAPGSYILFNTGQAISGTLGVNLEGMVGGYQATLAFANGDQDLVLMVVPEPSSVLLFLGGIAASLALRRRRA